MKFIEDFRATHIEKYPENKEIWIVGPDPSLGDFPGDFFDDKVSIAINRAIGAFPNCTYWHASHPEIILWVKENHPEILKKSILLYPMVSFVKSFPKKLTGEESLELLGKYKDDPVYLRWHWILGNRSQFMKLLPQTIDDIIAGRSCKYICLSTIAHYAIQIAVVLGTKEITLVGCGSKVVNNKEYAQVQGLSNFCPIKRTPRKLRIYMKRFARHRLGTKILAEAFEPHGIKVRRYYYNEGYENIV